MQGMLEKHTHVNLRFSFIVVSSFTYQKWFKLHTKKGYISIACTKSSIYVYIYNLKTKKTAYILLLYLGMKTESTLIVLFIY